MPNRHSPASSARDYSPVDRLLMRTQDRLVQLAGRRRAAAEADPAHPGAGKPDVFFDASMRRHVAGLMRVNHAGEVAAQALYRGQALVARSPAVRRQLLDAAAEERAHLHWCEQRLRELDDAPSVLTPLWYAGSFAIGATAGLAGDRTSLGFVEETERQVSEHLDDHLSRLPEQDARSRAILKTMREDEERHGRDAKAAGAKTLPGPVRRLMSAVAGVMKFGAYRI
jgi:ubiquinone biosynthesis monooxygenase Coq7